MDNYLNLWRESVQDTDNFWAKEAEMINWIVPYKKVWSQEEEFVGKWFVGGKLNVADQCTTRWAKKFPEKVAFTWVGEEDSKESPQKRVYTYKELAEEVNQAANMLRTLGVERGDRICLWMPMIPELIISQLACAKVGAIHSVVFGGFSAQSVKERIQHAECKILITADGCMRAARIRPMKE